MPVKAILAGQVLNAQVPGMRGTVYGSDSPGALPGTGMPDRAEIRGHQLLG